MQDTTMAVLSGWRFKPDDEELLNSFLKKKILGLPLSFHMIVEADVYGDDPKNLTARYKMANKDGEWLFFTSTSRKHPGAGNSSRASRSAGAGRWKATQRIKTVLDSAGNVLGSKQSFCYMERCSSGGERKTIWLMEEFSIHDLRTKAGASTIIGSNKLDEWVICKIYPIPKARKAHRIQGGLHEIQTVEMAASKPPAKKRRIEESSTPSPNITNSFQIHQPADDTLPHSDATLPHSDAAVPMFMEAMGSHSMPDTLVDCCFPTQHMSGEPFVPNQDIGDSFHIHQLANDTLLQSDSRASMDLEMMDSFYLHPIQDIDDHYQTFQLPDNALPQPSNILDIPIDGCSPTQYVGEELSIPSQDIIDSIQIQQLANDISSQSNSTVSILMDMMNSLCMHPNQNIADHRRILQLLDDALPWFNDILDTSVDGFSPTQHAPEALSTPSQSIVNSIQIHQPADNILPHSDPALVEAMEGPEHVPVQTNPDHFLKDIEAKNSSNTSSSKIMQAHDEEVDEMAALLGSFCYDSLPPLDDIF